MRRHKRECLLLLLAALLLSGCDPAPGGGSDATAAGSGIDALERQLEIERHERLLRIKSDPGSTLAEFSTDGCSGGLTIGWEYLAANIAGFQMLHGTQPAWEDCCVAHDRHYHTGGPGKATVSESLALRKQADLELQACVRETGMARAPALSDEYGLSYGQVTALYETIAELMYRAVRIGGVPCSGLPWRWGYGWPAC
jgi:predicted small secreted protein